MVKQNVKTVIILTVYLITIVSVAFFAYEEGYYTGLKTLCPRGAINIHPDGFVRCDMPVNDEFDELFLEVNYYG